MEIFRGYVATDGKAPIMKYTRNAPLLSLEEVQSLSSYSGVIADNIVLVDFDIREHGEKMLEIVRDMGLRCRAYRTAKGMHFYFRNEGKIKKNDTDIQLACGLKADFKLGGRNGLGNLKEYGVEKKLVYDSDDEYQAIPNFLLPVRRSDIDLLGLGEGDGRNSELFRYIPTLQALGLLKEDVREIGRVINRYILKTPLGEQEFDVVFRDDAFVKIEENFLDKNGFRHDQFGDYLISENHIVKIDGQLHIYKEGIYVNTHRDIEVEMVRKLPKLKAAQRAEVMKYIDLKAEVKSLADAEYIAFRNGLYSLASGSLLPFSPEIAITNQIPWDYNPDAYSDIADRTLDKLSCSDGEIRSLLEECMGYCFYRRNQLGKAFFLTGDKSNGKSTFLSMLRDLLGEENTSSLDLSELDERFSIAGLAGKLANIGDDISDEFLQGRSIAIFKKIVTGDRIKAEYKGENPFQFSPYVKLLFSANDIPRTKDRTGAVLRRMVIIPFNATFSKDDPDYDPYIAYKLKGCDVMEYLAKVAIGGLRRVIEGNGFSESGKVQSAIKEYESDNNPILAFFEEVPEAEIENQLTNEVYSRYKVFCVENNAHPISKSSFSREINRRYGIVSKMTRIDGKPIRIYKKAVSNT